MNPKNSYRRRHGLTLVELMVASTLGLMLVIGVVEAFRQITQAISRGRASVQLSGELRTLTNSMRSDFEGITVQAIPGNIIESRTGYFEIIEGVDNDFRQSTAGLETLSGDTDDVLMFTSRRLTNPFSGRIAGNFIGSPRDFEIINSPNAEVIYWLEPRNTEFLRDGLDNNGDGTTDEPQEGQLGVLQHNGMPLATLRRRALLIRPDLNNPQGILVDRNNNPYRATGISTFLNNNDISIRINPNGTVSANSLADLTLRQNRIAHLPVNFPHLFDVSRLPFTFGEFVGEDVVMDQTLSFDIRVYDRQAKILTDPNDSIAITPEDIGYELALNNFTNGTVKCVGTGAYVDLGYAYQYTLNNNSSSFANLCKNLSTFSWYPNQYPVPYPNSNQPPLPLPIQGAHWMGHNSPSLLPLSFPQYYLYGTYRTYDTWTLEYERDGIDQDRDGFIDEGFNQLDDDGIGGVDNVQEYETVPPYPFPLRGFQVIVRAFQNSQQQLRQFTVSHDFTPE